MEGLSIGDKIKLNGNDMEQNIQELYKLFLSIYGNLGKEPIMFENKRIFVELTSFAEMKHEIFWHLISLSQNENFNVFPCKNDESKQYCNQNCINKTKVVMLSKNRESRICMYRSIRMHWLKEIISLANSKNQYISIWEKEGHKYIRYKKQVDNIDEEYIVILKIMNGTYRFVSCYPVFYINSSYNFEKDYQNFLRKNKSR